jgi:hypothetical protein
MARPSKVWHPQRILGNTELHQALKQLSPTSYVLHMVHLRIVYTQARYFTRLTCLAPIRSPITMEISTIIICGASPITLISRSALFFEPRDHHLDPVRYLHLGQICLLH